jgi:hypothetical protein
VSTTENTDAIQQSMSGVGGTATAAAVAATPRTPTVEQAGNVDKIRDILFGNQMREYESRFGRLEETLLKETADLRESTRKRIDSLESFLRKELESLAARLKAERDERLSASKNLGDELRNTADSLTKTIREAEDAAGEADRELRASALEQSKTLMDEIRSNQERVLAVLERRFQELRNSKTDRSALAELFTEVALRLNHEFRVPDGQS